MPAGLLPMLYGFRFDGSSIDTDCVRVELEHDRKPEDPNPIHVKAAQLRTVLGAGMFGVGFVFPVFADQLDSSAQNRHTPQPVRSAAERLPTAADLIAAAIIDAFWWGLTLRAPPCPDVDRSVSTRPGGANPASYPAIPSNAVRSSAESAIAAPATFSRR